MGEYTGACVLGISRSMHPCEIGCYFGCPPSNSFVDSTARNAPQESMTEFPVDSTALTGARKRIILAGKIDKLRHSSSKAKADRNWLKKSADELDIVLDDVRRRSKSFLSRCLCCSRAPFVRLFSALRTCPAVVRVQRSHPRGGLWDSRGRLLCFSVVCLRCNSLPRLRPD